MHGWGQHFLRPHYISCAPLHCHQSLSHKRVMTAKSKRSQVHIRKVRCKRISNHKERKERNRENPLSPLCWFLVVLGVSLIVSTIFCWELGAQSKSSFSSNLQSGNPSQRNPYKLKVIQLKPQRIEIEIIQSCNMDQNNCEIIFQTLPEAQRAQDMGP